MLPRGYHKVGETSRCVVILVFLPGTFSRLVSNQRWPDIIAVIGGNLGVSIYPMDAMNCMLSTERGPNLIASASNLNVFMQNILDKHQSRQPCPRNRPAVSCPAQVDLLSI